MTLKQVYTQMKIVLFRFEREKINFLECSIHSGELLLGDKEKISLESVHHRGEKYQKILDELLQIQTKYSPDIFAYQSPQKYRGTIKDEEGFANSAVLHLYCYQNNVEILELTPVTVRRKISIPNQRFKDLLEDNRLAVLKQYDLSKSDKLFEGLLYLFSLKGYF